MCIYIYICNREREKDASGSSIGQRKTKTTMILANKPRSICKQIRNDTSSTVCIASQRARKRCHTHLMLHAHALSCKNHLLISPVAIGYPWISCTSNIIKRINHTKRINSQRTTKLENLHKLILVLWNLHEVTISDNNWRTTSPNSLSQQYPILTAILSTHFIPSSTFSNAHNVNILYKSKEPKDGHGDKTAHLAALQLNFRKLDLGGAYDSSDPKPV